jgi:glycosyltransferase involved in cell wall biosynthesis
LISAVGRIAFDKGFDCFVDVAKKVLQHHKVGVYFILVGGEEELDFANLLKQKVTDYGISDHFHFVGFRTDIPNILAASDIFVLSSRKEGHPYVMLEAMASNCAVVAFNCAGVEETIEEGDSGFIVPIGDINTMAERLLLLIDSVDLRQTLAKSAKQRIEAFFTAEKTATELMTVYEKLLQQPNKIAGSIAIELFVQNCVELGHLGEMYVVMNERLKRVEHLADFIQNNPISKSLRYLRKLV